MESLWDTLIKPMNLPLLWFIFFLLMAVAEMLTPFFGLVLVGASGLIAGGFALVGFSFPIQVAAFAVSCFLFLVLLRPRIVAKLHSKAHIPERTEALAGKMGEVTQNTGPDQSGRVTVNGEDWAAQSEAPLPQGTKIKVIGADGIVLKVAKAN